MFGVTVVEDDPQTGEQLMRYIRDYAREKGLEIRPVLYMDAETLLREYTQECDILLLDIELPGVNGMEAAKRIRRQDRNVVIVFITNMAQYAIEGYTVGALDFVLKPVNYNTFALKFTRALRRTRSRRDKTILLKHRNGVKKIAVSHIYYIDIQDRVLHYHTAEGEYIVRGTLQAAENELKDHHFVKCNHWYLVNLRHVTDLEDNLVTVAGSKLEISRRQKNVFLDAVTEYVAGLN